MKAALIIMNLERGGGAEHDVVNLSTGLQKAGHTPVVITAGGWLCRDIESEGIPVLRMPVDHRSPLPLYRNACAIAEAVESHHIEILNPQGVYPAISCHWASRFLRTRGMFVPNIVTIPMLSKLTWWYYRIGATVLNHSVDHVIVESECEAGRLRRHGLCRPHTVIPNCFPPSRFAAANQSREEIRKELGWSNDTTCFIMPARMSHEKRHDLLFEALRRPEVASLPILCYLAGDGAMLTRNRVLARRRGVADRVVFGGYRRDLPRLYKAADVFLLCSSAESLPLSIREGMVASLPILSTNVGGISEAVEDGRSGILIPNGDSAALAIAMAKLATNAGLRHQMGQRAHEIFQQKFDYPNWIRRTVEVMSRVREEYLRTFS